MGRAPCCDKSNVKKGPWSPQEDAKLKSYIHNHGTGGNWIALPQKIGLKRCGKSCRLRWLNYLRPNLKHGGFTEDEDNLICSLYVSIGSRWSIIATQLPGRTDNDIKNYWNTRLKKKLLSKHRRTEQPPPQPAAPLLAEYANQQNYWLQTNINSSMPPKFEAEISYDHTDQLYNYSDHRVYCGTKQSDFCSFNGLADFNFPAFDDHNIPPEIIYSLPALQFGGVDGFSPVEMCNSNSSMICSESSTSWGDLGSTIYPSDLINYQVCHEKMQQDLALFDEPRLLGYYSK